MHLPATHSFARNIPRGSLLIAALFFISSAVNAQAVKVAFTGDQGVGSNSKAVLSLIADEGTDLLMIQGDLGYGENAASQWEANLNDALGRNFPTLVVVGNHENYEWPIYKRLTQQRIDRIGALSCSGDTGVKSVCRFNNLDIVHVAPGVNEVAGVKADDNYADYIRSNFQGSSNRWRICSWHKNQNVMQTGSKGNSTGWDVYDACLDAGAIITVAHEHAYSRTHLLSNFENQTIVHRNNDMTIKPGQSFAFVSGLGGREVRAQKRGGDHWASIYTSSQGASPGALFCTFRESTADCYFKAIDGSVPDRFTLRLGSNGGSTTIVSNQANTSVSPPGPAAGDGYVFSRTDKDEYRWISRDSSGAAGSVWIDKACADSKGGPGAYGDWGDLMDRASKVDNIASPCNGNEVASSSNSAPSSASTGTGYVFSRTDKNEYRWVGRDASGGMGSVWIDKSCADSLGGPAASGDWGDLTEQAPQIDNVASPCDGGGGSQFVSSSDSVAGGYVFSRTDSDELRWIDKADSGQLGSTWIDKACADKNGGVLATGDWHDLMALAPALDAIGSPCY